MKIPTAPYCERTACAKREPHVGQVHLDPRSPLYDGPETALNALPADSRHAGWALLGASREDGWRRQIVDIALDTMAHEILHQRQLRGSAYVDRDRGIREAMKRAEDCAAHGADLTAAYDQIAAIDQMHEQIERERLVWVELVSAIQEGLRGRTDEVSVFVLRMIDKGHSRAMRARNGRKAAAPQTPSPPVKAVPDGQTSITDLLADEESAS